MFAYAFINFKGEFDIYESPFIGGTITKAASHTGLFVIYISM